MVRDLDPINKGFDPLNSEHILKKNKHIIQNTRMSHAEVEHIYSSICFFSIQNPQLQIPENILYNLNESED